MNLDGVLQAHESRLMSLLCALRFESPQAVRPRVLAVWGFVQDCIEPGTTVETTLSCALYRETLRTHVPATPVRIPDPTPDWLQRLPDDERQFVVACAELLGRDEQVSLLLCFYVGVTLEQLRCVLSADQPRTPEHVMNQLEQGLRRVLARLSASRQS